MDSEFILIIIVFSKFSIHLTPILKYFNFLFSCCFYLCLNIYRLIKNFSRPQPLKLFFIIPIIPRCISMSGTNYTFIVIETPIKISKSLLFVLALIILKIIRLSHILIIIIRYAGSFAAVIRTVYLPVSLEYHYEYVQRCYANQSNCKCKRRKYSFLSLASHLLIKQFLLIPSFLLIFSWFLNFRLIL